MAQSDFDRFWAVCPRRTGKLAAEAEFKKALKRATVEELIAGMEQYKAHKPAYADWCHPRTWLHQGRWMDEWDEPVIERADDYGHRPPCRSYAECLQKRLAKGA
jgi:hypothetical protein